MINKVIISFIIYSIISLANMKSVFLGDNKNMYVYHPFLESQYVIKKFFFIKIHFKMRFYLKINFVVRKESKIIIMSYF